MNNNVSETIERFLNNDNEQFVIPNYQRRYAWENKQVKDLFDDIYYLDRDQTHLLNMTILITSDNRRFRKTQIVDGQQRITTLILLIKALLEKYISLGKSTENDYQHDMKKCLYARTERGKEIKIKLGKLDRDIFESIIEGDEQQKDFSISKLQIAYKNLKDEIEKFSQSDVEEFWLKLKDNVEIIDYCVTVRGTVGIEAAVFGTPMVIIYKMVPGEGTRLYQQFPSLKIMV